MLCQLAMQNFPPQWTGKRLSWSEHIPVHTCLGQLMQCFCQNKYTAGYTVIFPPPPDRGCMGPFRDENTSCLKLINTPPTLLTPSLWSASVYFLLSRFPLPQKSTSSASSEASETCQSVSECSSPTAVSTVCAAQAH